MASGIAELAPPNEGGDDRERAILGQRLDEMLVVEYPSLNDSELEQLLSERQDDTDTDAATEVPAQRAPVHDTLPNQPEAESRLSEPIVFTESLVGERGLTRRYRQRALGIHAGYLMVRRQHLVQNKRGVRNGEFRLG